MGQVIFHPTPLSKTTKKYHSSITVQSQEWLSNYAQTIHEFFTNKRIWAAYSSIRGFIRGRYVTITINLAL